MSKVKVPKCFDSWYTENKLDTPTETISALVHDVEYSMLDSLLLEYYHNNYIKLAYAILEGYEVE